MKCMMTAQCHGHPNGSAVFRESLLFAMGPALWPGLTPQCEVEAWRRAAKAKVRQMKDRMEGMVMPASVAGLEASRPQWEAQVLPASPVLGLGGKGEGQRERPLRYPIYT